MAKVLKRISQKRFEQKALEIMKQLSEEILQRDGIDFVANVEAEGFEYSIDDKQHFVFFLDGKIVDEETSFNYGRYNDEGMLISPPDLDEYLEIRLTRKENNKDV